MEVVLVKSNKVGENEIRIPRKVRNKLNIDLFKNLEIGDMKGTVHQAYKADLKNLKKLHIPKEDRDKVVFVSGKLLASLGLGNFIKVDLDRLKEIKPLLDEITKITLGTDPEFAIIDKKSGDLVRADDIVLEYDLNENGALGSDGSGLQAELRPEPSDNPMEVAKSIRNILEGYLNSIFELYDPISVSDWTYFGDIRYFGGHIHIDTPNINYDKPDNEPKLSGALERVLNSTVLPLVARFEKSPARRRGYWDLVWRSSYKNGNYILEWRYPSSEVIIHPNVFIPTLELVKVISGMVYDIIKEENDIDSDKIINKLSIEEVDPREDFLQRGCVSAEKWIDNLGLEAGYMLVKLSKEVKRSKLNRNLIETWIEGKDLFK